MVERMKPIKLPASALPRSAERKPEGAVAADKQRNLRSDARAETRPQKRMKYTQVDTASSFVHPTTKSKAGVKAVDFKSVLAREEIDPASGRSFKELCDIQAGKFLPLVLGVCACPEHKTIAQSIAKTTSSHPLCINGTLLFNALAYAEDFPQDRQRLDVERHVQVDAFSQRNFHYYLINPGTLRGFQICDKDAAQKYFEEDAITNFGVLRLNGLDLLCDDEVDQALYAAGMFYAGIGVERDLPLANSLFDVCRKSSRVHAQADALLMCIDDRNYKLLVALVKLGLDPNQEDEDGLTAVEQASKLNDKVAFAILRGARNE